MTRAVTNADRAEWAFKAAVTFHDATRGPSEPLKLDESIGDLICNLLHLAREHAIEPDALITRARAMFDEEERAD